MSRSMRVCCSRSISGSRSGTNEDQERRTADDVNGKKVVPGFINGRELELEIPPLKAGTHKITPTDPGVPNVGVKPSTLWFRSDNSPARARTEQMKISWLQNVMFASAFLFSCSAPGYNNPSLRNSDGSPFSFLLPSDEESPKSGDRRTENDSLYRRQTEHGERAE